MLDLAGTEAAGALSLLLLGNGDDVDLEVVELWNQLLEREVGGECDWWPGPTYAEGLEQVLGVGINIELAGLGLGNIQSRDLRDVLVLALTLLLLELEGDTANGATLNALHEVGGVACDL